MFYCRVYNHTGFNLVNVPDSIELLNQCTHKDYPVIDILQLYHNTVIKLKITSEEELYDADFLVLSTSNSFDSDFYRHNFAAYVINSYTMTSSDVASVDVTMEPFLTCGGVRIENGQPVWGLGLKDGMTERHHVDNLQEKFGDYVEDDEMLQPSYPMTMEFGGQYFYEKPGVGETSGVALIWTIARIDSGINFDINNNIDWIVNSDAQGVMTGIQSNSSGNKRTLTNWQCFSPWIQNVQDFTAARTDVIQQSTHKDFCNLTAYACRTDFDFGEITGSLKRLYEWGITDMIKEAYFVPKFWADACATYSFNVANILRSYVCTSAGYYTSMKKRIYSESDPIHGAFVQKCNPRALYGKNYAVTFVSTGSGEMITKNPEDLIGANRSIAADQPFFLSEGYGATTSGDEAEKNIIVIGWGDIRPGGTPKFHVLNRGDEGDFTHGFYIKDFIKGGNWSKIDISAMGVNGLAQQVRDFYNKKNLADYDAMVGLDYGTTTDLGDTNLGALASKVGIDLGPWNGLANMGNANRLDYEYNRYNIGLPSNFGNAPDSAVNGWIEGNQAGNERAKNLLLREAQARSEASQFAAGLVAKPNIQFSGSIDGDASMNSLVAFRLVPDFRDIQKFDKILNMYGYRITEPVTTQMMTNRPKYNYLKAKGVQVTSSKKVPKSVLEEAGAAFSQGLRIWHVKPSYNYTPGANKNEEEPDPI